jgi:hypothetical protein
MNQPFTELDSIESELLLSGVLRYEPFISAAGLAGDQKVVLDDLWFEHERDSDLDLLARKVIGSISVRAALLSPTHFVSVPSGGEPVVERMVPNYRDVATLKLQKQSAAKGKKSFLLDEIVELGSSARVILVDDVLTTGHSLLAAVEVPELAGKIVGAAVVWDRREAGSNLALPFPVVSVVKRYIPLNG